MNAADLLRLADDPTDHTPSSEDVKALADQIEATIQRVKALEPRVQQLERSWVQAQVNIQRQGVRRRRGGGHATGDGKRL